jgi:hypothetical protein
MKQTGLLKLSYFTLLVITLCLFSCKREYADGVDRTVYTLSGTAVTSNVRGSQQLPTTLSTMGTLTGTYNASTNVLQYNINWKGLSSSATDVTIDGADRTGNISSLFKLQITTPGVNGTASGSVSLYEAQEDGLLKGNWEYVIHNSSFTNGELSGEIKVSPY